MMCKLLAPSWPIIARTPVACKLLDVFIVTKFMRMARHSCTPTSVCHQSLGFLHCSSVAAVVTTSWWHDLWLTGRLGGVSLCVFLAKLSDPLLQLLNCLLQQQEEECANNQPGARVLDDASAYWMMLRT